MKDGVFIADVMYSCVISMAADVGTLVHMVGRVVERTGGVLYLNAADD